MGDTTFIVVKPIAPTQSLCSLLEEEAPKIARLWSKRLLTQVTEMPVSSTQLRQSLLSALADLTRLLKTRGDEAISLWPELLRQHAFRRYEQNFKAADIALEVKTLHQVLLYFYACRNERVAPEFAEYLAELMGEASASMFSGFARAIRTEEVRLKESSLMESILHHVDIGILMADVDGTVAYVTPAVGKLLGLSEKSILGAPQFMTGCLAQLHARHLDGRPFRLQDMPYMRLLKEPGPVPNEWMKFKNHRQKDDVWLELSATPVFDASSRKQLVGVVQTMTDRTQSAQKSQELSKAYEDLRSLQGRLLKRTRVQALGQLAADASHALNNLLNVLRLRVVLLQKEFRPEHLAALDKTVTSMGDLVTRLQEFSVAREEQTLSRVPLDQIAQEAFELLDKDEVPEEKEWRWHLSNPGKVQVDAPLLREVFLNVLSVVSRRVPESGHIDISSRSEGENCVLQVSDEGPVLSEGEVVQWFDPWTGQTGRPREAFFLSLGKSQIRQWGGDIECRNREDGQGIVCDIRLPTVKEEDVPKTLRKRVLVVDDDVEASRMLAQVLTQEGHEVETAESAQQALAAWERKAFDAALLDALMPDVSGWELAQWLRQRSPSALIGMVTGVDVRGQSRAHLSVLDAVFHKPVDVGAVEEFLSQAPTSEDVQALH